MAGNKKRLQERIDELEEKGRLLEEKTKQAMDLLESLVSEFDDFQNTILLGPPRPISQPRDFANPPVFQETREIRPNFSDIPCLKPGRIEMTGTQEENDALKEGWWQSEGNFRWAGKDSKHPVLYFSVSPDKEYELTAKIFIPGALAKKSIKIMANDTTVADFAVDKEMQVEKKIKIPQNIITKDILKIAFKSDIWNPKDLDPNVSDNRTLSLAFDYIELN